MLSRVSNVVATSGGAGPSGASTPTLSMDAPNDAVIAGSTRNPMVMLNTYDGFNRLATSEVDRNGTTTNASYTYNGMGLRQSKTVNGVTTGHIWDGSNIVSDITGGQSTTYVRGLSLIGTVSPSGLKQQYVTDGHGDVKGLVNLTSGVFSSYGQYDAFGNQASGSVNTQPFGYCGEYTDSDTGTGFVYLRARYYDPGMGRFASEDPARDGLNWYVYASNNPVNFWDPSGQKVTIWDQQNCTSAEVAQIQQATDSWNASYLIYIGAVANGDTATAEKAQASMDAASAQAAAARKPHIQSYETLGDDGIVTVKLPAADRAKGVTVYTASDGSQFMDVSSPVNFALIMAKSEFESHQLDFHWFADQVKAEGPWDIKLPDKWRNTIGTTFPGAGHVVRLNGTFVTPEDIGNQTYGYLGSAAGFPEDVLLMGGDAATTGFDGSASTIPAGTLGVIISADSPNDKANIRIGVNWYNNRNK